MIEITGYRVLSDTNFVRETLLLEREPTGFHGATYGELWEAFEYRITTPPGGLVGIELRSPGTAWTFYPDQGKCERIGLPIKPLDDRRSDDRLSLSPKPKWQNG